MIFGCSSSSMPDDAGFRARFSFMLVLFNFALPPVGIHSCPMGSLFLRKSRASNVCPPLLMHSAAPIAESTSWDDPVEMEHIPTCVIASTTVAREPVQHPIRLDDKRRMHSGFLNGNAELLNRSRFDAHPLKGGPGPGAMYGSQSHSASLSALAIC